MSAEHAIAALRKFFSDMRLTASGGGSDKGLWGLRHLLTIEAELESLRGIRDSHSGDHDKSKDVGKPAT
jgi:hypothetical protein